MIKHFLPAFVFLVFSAAFTSAQTTFQRAYGGVNADDVKAIEQTADGGYILVGYTQSYTAGGQDIYLVKTNSTGDVEWAKAYGGTADDAGTAVQQTADGGYIVAGFTNSFGFANGNPDVIYFKTDNNGNVTWAKTIGCPGYDLAFSCQVTDDGGYVIFGWNITDPLYEGDYYLIKTDANGDTLWTRIYRGPFDDYGISVQQTADHGYIMTGTTNSYGAGGFDMLNIKADVNGNLQWAKTYGGLVNDGGSFVRQTADGGYITIGGARSFGAGNSDMYLVRSDANGDTLWTRTYGNTQSDGGNCVRENADGSFMLAGSYGVGAISKGAFIKTDAGGNVAWTKYYGGAMNDALISFVQATDGGYAIGGNTASFGAGNDDFYCIKTGATGNSGCNDTTQNILLMTMPPTVQTNPVPVVLSYGVMTNPILQVHNGVMEDTLCTRTCSIVAPTSADMVICAGKPVTLTANGNGTIYWYSSPSSSAVIATGNTFTAENLSCPVTYYINAKDSFCSSAFVPVHIDLKNCEDSIPNVFTPNGDGKNDVFLFPFPFSKCFHAEIFNRWGNKVYEWTDSTKGWDGKTTSGTECSAGTYYFLLNYCDCDQPRKAHGYVELMRSK